MASSSPWDNAENYYWVVICKNRKFHDHQNVFSGHKIRWARPTHSPLRRRLTPG